MVKLVVFELEPFLEEVSRQKIKRVFMYKVSLSLRDEIKTPPFKIPNKSYIVISTLSGYLVLQCWISVPYQVRIDDAFEQIKSVLIKKGFKVYEGFCN